MFNHSDLKIHRTSLKITKIWKEVSFNWAQPCSCQTLGQTWQMLHSDWPVGVRGRNFVKGQMIIATEKLHPAPDKLVSPVWHLSTPERAENQKGNCFTDPSCFTICYWRTIYHLYIHKFINIYLSLYISMYCSIHKVTFYGCLEAVNLSRLVCSIFVCMSDTCIIVRLFLVKETETASCFTICVTDEQFLIFMYINILFLPMEKVQMKLQPNN